MEIATWNVNSLRVRLAQLLEWLAANPVDVIALQETKLPDENFPRTALEEAGYRVAFSGERTYNGVAVLTREAFADLTTSIPAFTDTQRRVLGLSTGGVRVVNVYVPNGEMPGSDKFAYKLRWLAALREWIGAEVRRHERLIVLGDFNIAPDDRDVHDPQSWAGGVHVSPEERAELQALLSTGLVDVFRRFEQPPQTFSWWDYRQMAFRRNHGLRIDLILAHRALAPRCRACRIDQAPRKLERPSDHTPVVASFDI